MSFPPATDFIEHESATKAPIGSRTMNFARIDARCSLSNGRIRENAWGRLAVGQ
ncbi:hypothetical protein J2Y48_000605 [Mycoplana sp. BE70]|uniref:hypothetical protein n=1 Tax=Mycoplana sp. BE70 TaxID=2817775 RepID=UPI002856EDAD|nr:hypothetical protein [Mycoplana sp. BE70]MDR6755332.1 hypothetical protein [Mycoplana sp. BE70]